MKLNRVTITGADDSTDLLEMVALSEEFPFVEWAILVSRSQEGNYRFPSRAWINRLIGLVRKDALQLATHVCGSWVRELLVGDLRWDDLPDVLDYSRRVQINTHSEKQPFHYTRFLANLRDMPEKTFIFQLDGINNHLALSAWMAEIQMAGLFDTSAGAGRVPKQWPTVCFKYDHGFAGGLGPDNVVEQLGLMQNAQYIHNANVPFWIDMERRVRTEDDSALDMTKVRKVLELTAPFIERN
jgi:hypothetical protein